MAKARRIPRAWAKKALLAFAAALFALGVAELLVRVLRIAPEIKSIGLSTDDCVYERSPDPLLSYVLKANYRCENPDLARQYESTNSHGLRDRERSVEKPPGVRRVILLGDSVVEGHGIRESETISRQLEGLLSGENTEVLNFGVSGYCTLSEVELLEVKGLAFKPDVVVLVFVENDFQNFNREAFVLASIDRPVAVKYLFLHAHLFRLAAINLNLWHFGVEVDPARWNQQAIGENNVVEGLRRLSQLSRKHGFAPLIAIWPGFTDTSVVDMHHMPGNSDPLIVERLGSMYRIPTIRLSRNFVADSASKRDGLSPLLRYTIQDGMHPSAEGCRVAAQALKEYLAQLRAAAPEKTAATNEQFESQEDAEAVAAAAALGGGKPTKSEVYNNIAMGLLNSGKSEQSLEYFKLALEEDNGNGFAHINFGNALAGRQRFEEAETHYQAALQRKPAEAHYNWGNALAGRGRFEEAVAHYQEALRIKPNDAEVHNNCGNALSQLGHNREALEHYQAALRIKPNFLDAHYNCGIALAGMGRHEEALSHYQQALQIKPDLAEAHYNWGNALASLGRPEEAATHFHAALRIKPDYAEAHNNWGNALVGLKRFEEAVTHYEAALRLQPDFKSARENLRRIEALQQQKNGPDKP